MKTNLTLLSLCLTMTACVYNEELVDVADLYPTKQITSLSYSMQHTLKAGETDGSRSIPNEAFAHVQICIKNEMPDLQLTVEGIRLCLRDLSFYGEVLGNRYDTKHPFHRDRTVGVKA